LGRPPAKEMMDGSTVIFRISRMKEGWAALIRSEKRELMGAYVFRGKEAIR
jgi:hypothetical protein